MPGLVKEWPPGDAGKFATEAWSCATETKSFGTGAQRFGHRDAEPGTETQSFGTETQSIGTETQSCHRAKVTDGRRSLRSRDGEGEGAAETRSAEANGF